MPPQSDAVSPEALASVGLSLPRVDAPAKVTGRTNVGTPSATVSPDQIEQMIAARTVAKKAKNYAEADRIRKVLLDAGIVLEDTPQGTSWRRA